MLFSIEFLSSFILTCKRGWDLRVRAVVLGLGVQAAKSRFEDWGMKGLNTPKRGLRFENRGNWKPLASPDLCRLSDLAETNQTNWKQSEHILPVFMRQLKTLVLTHMLNIKARAQNCMFVSQSGSQRWIYDWKPRPCHSQCRWTGFWDPEEGVLLRRWAQDFVRTQGTSRTYYSIPLKP